MRVIKVALESNENDDIELLSLSLQEEFSKGKVFDVAIISSPRGGYKNLLHELSLTSTTVILNIGLSPLSEGELTIVLAAILYKHKGCLELFNLNTQEFEIINNSMQSKFYKFQHLFLGILGNKQTDFLHKIEQCTQATNSLSVEDGPFSASMSKYLYTLIRIYKLEHRYTMQINFEGISSINSEGFFDLFLQVKSLLKGLKGDESFFSHLLERKNFFESGLEASSARNLDKSNVNANLKYYAWVSVFFLKMSNFHKKNDNYQIASAFLFRHLEEYLKTFLIAFSNGSHDSYGNFLIDGQRAKGLGSYMKKIEKLSILNLKEGVDTFDFTSNSINHRNDSVFGHGYNLTSSLIYDNHFQNIKKFINQLETEINEKYFTLSKSNDIVIGKLNINDNFSQIIETVYS